VVKVAVIVPVYNGEKYIEDALASLLRQREDADLDIVVVNDGSTDGTLPIVRRLASEAPEIRIVERPHSGLAQTRNAGIDALRPDADLVTQLDSDDLSPAGRFARDVALFRNDPELELHYGAMRVFRDERRGLLEPDPLLPTVDVRAVQLGGLLIRTSLLARVGRFDESFSTADDVDFVFRALELGPKLQVVDDVAVYYRRHGLNMSREDVGKNKAEFARAMMMAAVRRRRSGTARVPPGFFNAKDTLEALEWW
jgi:glycosyltransferase involved in cell wall biosynthesis